jgi:hypothetical protein
MDDEITNHKIRMLTFCLMKRKEKRTAKELVDEAVSITDENVTQEGIQKN